MNYASFLTFGVVSVILLLLASFGFLLLWRVARSDKMPMEYLLADKDGYASMSRFQLLIFTFTVAFAFLYIATKADASELPSVPDSVLLLIGISGSSFLVGKSLDGGSSDAETADSEDEPAAADTQAPSRTPGAGFNLPSAPSRERDHAKV